MWKFVPCLVLAPVAAMAQYAGSMLSDSVSGAVTDAETGAPLWGRTVTIREIPLYARAGRARTYTADTDAHGLFKLDKVPPGHYSASVKGDDLASHAVPFDLIPGQNLTTLNFAVAISGTISGRVTDQSGKPVPGAAVLLITKTYQNGKPRYGQKVRAVTDSDGRYSLADSSTSGPYKVMVKAASGEIPAISIAPEDPAKRSKVLIPTYYPSALFADGAESVSLHSAQKLEGIDLKAAWGPQYCAEGIMKGEGQPGSLDFEINEPEVRQGGLQTDPAALPTHGKSASDGKFRICGLHTGEYRLVVSRGAAAGPPILYSSLPLVIDNRDTKNLEVDARRSETISGEVVWEKDAPAQRVDASIGINLVPLDRGPFPGTAQSSIPGQFALRTQARDEYAVLISGMPPGLYAKDVTYGGVSVLHSTLSLATPSGDGKLRVVVARDGGSVSARVTDWEGKAVPSATLWIVPSITGTAAELEAVLISGTADANGAYGSPTLPPGKYRVFATTIRLERTAENIERLTNVRFQGAEVEIGSSGGKQVILQPITVF